MGNSEWVLEMALFLLFISLFVVTPIYPLRCPPFICVSSLTHSLSISLSLCVPPSLFNSDMFSPILHPLYFVESAQWYLLVTWQHPGDSLSFWCFPASHRITSHHTTPHPPPIPYARVCVVSLLPAPSVHTALSVSICLLQLRRDGEVICCHVPYLYLYVIYLSVSLSLFFVVSIICLYSLHVFGSCSKP